MDNHLEIKMPASIRKRTNYILKNFTKAGYF